MSDREEEIIGRSYVWRLNKAELEEELRRFNIAFETDTTVIDMKRMLSRYLKRVQSECLSQASADESMRPIKANVRVRGNDDEIKSLAPSRPASRNESNTTSFLLKTMRAEMMKFREQMFDDIQAQLVARNRPEEPKPEPIREPPRHHQNRLDDDLFVTSQTTPRVYPHRTQGQSTTMASQQSQKLGAMDRFYERPEEFLPTRRY
ncbi:hypothetical protein PV327_011662 [Microctonus hyperodae]|uniref:Uncharacterized protein n=1 Tax=Microctonus hyperodae TaxID=165561 RepID=A0AA39FH37_MICHY|nr:hypothetical protein PV327_011662 [Microctonus hyperodae]